ncbi:F-box protein, partial [Trifolium medium]|nr:F-box protein [Trifolium medium]
KGESPDGSDDKNEFDRSIIPYSITSFVDNPSFTLFADHHYLFNIKDCSWIAGSCHGLICLTGIRFLRILRGTSTNYDQQEYEYCLRLWNPATRAISEKIGCFIGPPGFNFSFGCDNSTGTFKVVVSQSKSVRVLSFGDNVWRNVESFPVLPLHADLKLLYGHSAVFCNGTLNWLASHNSRLKYITVEQLIILSLDLGTETYNMYKLPKGFDKMPPSDSEPTVGVLGDLLCFSYYAYNETDFIIWQMKNFGDEESWTQFLKISFHDLQLDQEQAILYNWRDQRVERSR